MSKARAQLHLIQSPAAAPAAPASDLVLKGQIDVLSVVDVIQLVSNRTQSWCIVLVEQGLEASVTIVDGELADARWGCKSGTDALVEIVAMRTGTFEVQPFAGLEERTLFGLWQGNILAAVQRLDERTQAQSSVPAPAIKKSQSKIKAASSRSKLGEYDFDAILSDDAFDLPNESPADGARDADETRSVVNKSEDAPELTDLGFLALRAGDVEQAKAHWTKALELDPTNRALQFNLKKLQNRDER